MLFCLKHGQHGEKYNVQGEIELDNLELAQFIASELGKPLKYKLHDNPVSRPGHDLRYALDGDKLRALGFELPVSASARALARVPARPTLALDSCGSSHSRHQSSPRSILPAKRVELLTYLY